MKFKSPRHCQKLVGLIAVFSCLSVHAADVAPAEDSADGIKNRYERIILRNAFGLQDPPPPPAPPEAPPPPPPDVDIYFTGVSSLTGEVFAYLKTENKKDKAVNYYKLREGESQDGIEMLSINATDSLIKVKFLGSERNMNLNDNAAPASKAAPGKAVPKRPGSSARPPGLPSRPQSPTKKNNSSTFGRPSNLVPSATRTSTPRVQSPFVRSMRATQNSAVQVRTANGQLLNLQGGGSSINVRKRPAAPDVDPIEQRVLMEVDAAVNPNGPPIPPPPPFMQ